MGKLGNGARRGWREMNRTIGHGPAAQRLPLVPLKELRHSSSSFLIGNRLIRTARSARMTLFGCLRKLAFIVQGGRCSLFGIGNWTKYKGHGNSHSYGPVFVSSCGATTDKNWATVAAIFKFLKALSLHANWNRINEFKLGLRAYWVDAREKKILEM